MSLIYTSGDSTTTEAYQRNGGKVIAMWAPTGGIAFKNKPTELHSYHKLGNIKEISDISPEFINERDLFNVGYVKGTTNDGVKWSGSMTIEGNALEVKAALSGKDLFKYPAIKEGQTLKAAGHLVLIGADDDGTLRVSTTFLDCEIKFTDVAGATDGESTFTIEVICRSDVISTTGQVIPFKETYYAGTSPADASATVVNTAAPDASNATFALGAGNGSGITDAVLAVAYNGDKSGTAQEYIMDYKVDGKSSTAFAYNSATGVITPSTVLAAGQKIEVTYFIRTGAETWNSTRAYGVGEIVSYNNAYYQSDAADTGTTPAGSTPWPAFVGFGWDGSAGVGSKLIPYTSSNSYDFLTSWNNLNRI